ncbi:TetR family transcriptional regulator [Spiractinospora alimapuensis]|uniref:TetR/AcrR family transcriptional regulator n=1 Tax=Spiractinospora alimapuensis TaxID=2820884 RepID=UPI001F3C1F26|nr:TetR/AcrR family transcriptional regulator [Spiractinospora alimapuensis]QVQ52796.1 TetR family transcriptional regulator [Spiractinospora alimapuensis]
MSANPRSSAQVRRQERGLRRMEQILDAAEELIGEVGFEETTTNTVAARAGVSPGSLYQFFANKDALLDGVAERYTVASQDFWDQHLGEHVARLELSALIDQVLDSLTEFKTRRPAFWVLFHGSGASPRLAEVADRIRGEISSRLRAVFRFRAPHESEERLEVMANVSVATVRGLFPLVIAAESTKRPAVLAELKAVLHGYLASTIGAGSAPPP